jgi:hypothetical protein
MRIVWRLTISQPTTSELPYGIKSTKSREINFTIVDTRTNLKKIEVLSIYPEQLKADLLQLCYITSHPSRSG